MLYEPDQFDRLIDEPWVRAHVEGAIATIVADVDAAFGLDRLWPAVNEWDEYRDGQPAKVLYTGAAGVSWALETLRRRGHAETSLDLAAAALRALELARAEPDAAEDEHYRPGSLLHGETGPLLVAFLLASDAQLADDLHGLVHGNVANPTTTSAGEQRGRCWQRWRCTSGRARRAGWRRHASQRLAFARGAATTVSGVGVTITGASARFTVPPATRLLC